MSKIVIENLYKSFNDHVVLDGVNLNIPEKKSLVILGGSGSGKSVLIKTIVGLINPDKGSIKIDDEETTHINMNDRFKIMRKCGFLFQGGALFDSLNILENITFYAAKLNNLTTFEKRDLALEKLTAVGLSERVLDMYPAELSGGMQKRVSLARAIATNPEIIFFDEPTTGLDPIMANVINELIIKVREELGATTITITHDMHSAQMIATDVAMLYQGKIAWTGPQSDMDKSKNEILDQFVHGRTTGPISV